MHFILFFLEKGASTKVSTKRGCHLYISPFCFLLLCFWSLSCCITQGRLSVRRQTNDRTFYQKILKDRAEFMVPSITRSLPGLETAKQPHHHTTSTVFYTRCNTELKLFKKFSSFLVSLKNISQKVFGIIKMLFGKCEIGVCVCCFVRNMPKNKKSRMGQILFYSTVCCVI